ncbi:sugar phosphate isomerase/epimerase [Bacillaceae bacterium SIJ1]|uniref:sugar phosphate isomerase/epimerase family protein n=1 Tax=Litoribacterium kuwaitense TaxID=1398745 RepID=UPI0013EDBA2E|nr:sugar phosphate isomerase/epimerase family protein [Litoribacterium kuwaitense]NGP45456.1 sugar phosphate isomerase/epimerase [Litoribacterium kuwaitense]
MKKALSGAGLGAVKDVHHLITLAGDYGFAAIEASGASVLKVVDNEGLEPFQKSLHATGVNISTFGLPVEWRQSDAQFSQDLENLVPQARLAQSLGVDNFTTYVLPSTDWNAAQFMAKAVSRLKLCAQILKQYDVKLALEFVGPHHLRTTWKHPFIWSMAQMIDMIEAIDEGNTGLLLDAFHWYTTGGTAEDIRKAGVDKLVHVHLNDARDVPVEDVLDNDRLYPGEGVIDLTTFLQTLKNIGYEGAIAQEILTKEPPSETPEQLAQKSKEAYDKVFSRLS